MKKTDLENVRKEYRRLVNERDLLINHKTELLELMKDEKVKRYLELLNYIDINYNDPSDEQLVKEAFRNTLLNCNPLDSNHIMIYQGTYIYDRLSGKDYITYDFDNLGSFKTYIDLETRETYIIPIDYYLDFEEKYVTIYIPVDNYDLCSYYKNYLDVQHWFQKQLLIKSQSEVIKTLCKMYHTKHRYLLESKAS